MCGAYPRLMVELEQSFRADPLILRQAWVGLLRGGNPVRFLDTRRRLARPE
jgi:hypothetical protein